MTTASQLRSLVSVQRMAAGTDDLGQPNGAWTELVKLRADIRHPSGLEQLRGDGIVSRLRASIRVRLRSDITPAMRVVHGSTVYEIKAALPDLQTRAYLDLVCEAVT